MTGDLLSDAAAAVFDAQETLFSARTVPLPELEASLPYLNQSSYKEAQEERVALGWCKYPICTTTRKIIRPDAAFYFEYPVAKSKSLDNVVTATAPLAGYCCKQCWKSDHELLERLPPQDLLEDRKRLEKLLAATRPSRTSLGQAESDAASHLPKEIPHAAPADSGQMIESLLLQYGLGQVVVERPNQSATENDTSRPARKPTEANRGQDHPTALHEKLDALHIDRPAKLSPKTAPPVRDSPKASVMVHNKIVERQESTKDEPSLETAELKPDLAQAPPSPLTVQSLNFYPAPDTGKAENAVHELEESDQSSDDTNSLAESESQPEIELPPLSFFGQTWTLLSSMVSHDTQQLAVHGVPFTGTYDAEQVGIFSRVLIQKYGLSAYL
ncbi:hypothetical protein HDU91_002323 [Kappamyces sp. JEL0680]|nr:hypothetical protein HDU91_002323 [Kappamyces sp. JEL0680]